jgi:RNA polymerase sigma-70 factor (ECF subfamily)
MSESEQLKAAARGDEAAFAALVEPHRRMLHAHCYRMLGSFHDAEDAVQETLLRAWRSVSSFQGRSSLRSWLYTIATHACLRAIERRPRRVLPIDYGPASDPHQPLGAPLVESTWIDPYPDDQLDLAATVAGPEVRYEQRESVELAFIAALQHLPARQRAVLILRDVLGFSGGEVAEALETNAASVYSALQRAHAAVDQRLPAVSQQATLESLGDPRLREIVTRYVQAWEDNDVHAVAAMLSHDARLAMPPTPTWYLGRDAIAAGMRGHALSGRLRWRMAPTRANAQLAVTAQVWDHAAAAFVPHHTAVLTLRGELIDEVTAFLAPAAVAMGV